VKRRKYRQKTRRKPFVIRRPANRPESVCTSNKLNGRKTKKDVRQYTRDREFARDTHTHTHTRTTSVGHARRTRRVPANIESYEQTECVSRVRKKQPSWRFVRSFWRKRPGVRANTTRRPRRPIILNARSLFVIVFDTPFLVGHESRNPCDVRWKSRSLYKRYSRTKCRSFRKCFVEITLFGTRYERHGVAKIS